MKPKNLILLQRIIAGCITLFMFSGCQTSMKNQSGTAKRIPVIYSTDLYHPPQDPDDHYDLAILSSLEELEVKALIFDVATTSRNPEEAGTVALEQIAKITGQSPPSWKTGLINPLRSPDDQALDQPEEFQGGVKLIISTLEQSEEQVVMFLVGSCRDFVVAFNRKPELLREKVKAVYVNAGNGPKGIQTEWNVRLDPHAYVGLMFSGLPVYWCPCFMNEYRLCTPDDISAGRAFCTYYMVPNQTELLSSTRPMVKNYFSYALNRLQEDPLGFLDKEQQPLPETSRNMWCTGPFLHAAGRQIYLTQDNRWTACTPEKGMESAAIEVFRFDQVRIKFIMKEEDGKLLPEFQDAENAEPGASVQVFRYTHPDYNEIMVSTLKTLLETL